MELQQKLVKKANNKEAYDEIANQILHSEKNANKPQWIRCSEMNSCSADLQDFIKDQPSELTTFDEALVKRWLKQITI